MPERGICKYCFNQKIPGGTARGKTRDSGPRLPHEDLHYQAEPFSSHGKKIFRQRQEHQWRAYDREIDALQTRQALLKPEGPASAASSEKKEPLPIPPTSSLLPRPPPLQACLVCGCSSEHDAFAGFGNRICFCDLCKRSGCQYSVSGAVPSPPFESESDAATRADAPARLQSAPKKHGHGQHRGGARAKRGCHKCGNKAVSSYAWCPCNPERQGVAANHPNKSKFPK